METVTYLMTIFQEGLLSLNGTEGNKILMR